LIKRFMLWRKSISRRGVMSRPTNAWMYTVAPGVARALRDAALDPDTDTAQAALLGTLYLGRPDEVETWLAIVSSGTATARLAAWCLECWSGEPVPHAGGGTYEWPRVRRWWAETSRRFGDRVCYRSGAPVEIARLVEELAQDPLTLRADLNVRTGARPVQRLLTGNPVSIGEQAAMRSWWKVNSSKFPAGKLHRWGRTFEPNAVD